MSYLGGRHPLAHQSVAGRPAQAYPETFVPGRERNFVTTRCV